MKKVVAILILASAVGFGNAPLLWATDPRPAESPVKPVVIEDENKGEAGEVVQENSEAEEGREIEKPKSEQHAPTLEVGDTRKFMKESPLSAPQEEDSQASDWNY